VLRREGFQTEVGVGGVGKLVGRKKKTGKGRAGSMSQQKSLQEVIREGKASRRGNFALAAPKARRGQKARKHTLAQQNGIPLRIIQRSHKGTLLILRKRKELSCGNEEEVRTLEENPLRPAGENQGEAKKLEGGRTKRDRLT